MLLFIETALGFSCFTIETVIKDKVRIIEHAKGSAPKKASISIEQLNVK